MDQSSKQQKTKKTTKTTKTAKTATGTRRRKAPAPSSSQQAAQSQTTPVVTPVLPPRKKHTGLIILVIIVVLLILSFGGFLIWYFAYYNNPDKVVFDAMENFVGAEHLSLRDGRIKVKIDSNDERRMVADLIFDTSAFGLPSSTNAKLELSFYESLDPDASVSQTISINLGTVQMVDGTLYLKIGNLIESIDSALASQGLTLSDLGSSAQLVYDFVEEIDNEWWQISYRDLLELVSADQSQIRDYEDLYTCMIDVVNQNHSAELKTLYSQHQFVKITRVGALTSPVDESYGYLTAPNGDRYYEAGLDFDQLAGFVNALPDSQIAEQAYTCYNDYAHTIYGENYGGKNGPMNAEMFDEISADELRDIISEDYYIRLRISNFGHEVKDILIADIQEDAFIVYLLFGYDTAEVSAPDSYRPVTDLVEDLGDLIQGLLGLDIVDDDILNGAEMDERAVWES